MASNKQPSPPPAPEHLDEVAQAKWAELIAAIWNCEDRHPGDLDALQAYCVAWSRWSAAEKGISELGPIIKAPSGYPVQNPHVSLARHAADELRKWGKLLGVVGDTGPMRYVEGRRTGR
jgi:P27 family predicted phage terminase small subunit